MPIRPRRLVLPATLALAAGLGTAPAAQALTCDGGSGCRVLGSLQDTLGQLPPGSLDAFGSVAAPLSAGSITPAQ